MQEYRKKSYTVEAIQYTGKNGHEIKEWSRGAAIESPVLEPSEPNPTGEYMQVTHSGVRETFPAQIGDWIVKNRGVFYPVTDKTFNELYEPLTPPSPERGDKYHIVRNALIEISRYKSGMAEYYMQHNYRELSEICNKILAICEDALQITEPSKAPIWYTKDEMVRYLQNNMYDDQIANELADKWAVDLQGAFEKGWQKCTLEGKFHPAPPAPPDQDFETALEGEVAKIKQPNPELYIECAEADGERCGFEQGAKWARKYLDNPMPVDGPWRYGCEVSPPPPESGCVNTVTQWITDGTTRIEVDDFDADRIDNGEVQLASFLNKYGYKLSIDDPSPLIISHLEEQIKHLQSQQGVRWVKASERLPEFTRKVPVKINGDYGTGSAYDEGEGETSNPYFAVRNIEFYRDSWSEVYWLDDSPAPHKVDPELISTLQTALDCMNWMWDNMRLPSEKQYLQSDAFNIPANAIDITQNYLRKLQNNNG